MLRVLGQFGLVVYSVGLLGFLRPGRSYRISWWMNMGVPHRFALFELAPTSRIHFNEALVESPCATAILVLQFPFSSFLCLVSVFSL